jgi:hypothetical protein
MVSSTTKQENEMSTYVASPTDEQYSLFEQLGATGALKRRYAKLSDVLKFEWRPSQEPTPQGIDPDAPGYFHGLKKNPFDHLRGKRVGEVKPVELPAKNVKWADFRPVLASARKVEVFARAHGSYYGLVTASDPNAQLLFQWDNPVSWYFRHGGAPASDWSVLHGWNECTAVFLKPNEWGEKPLEHHGHDVFFAMKDARVKLNYFGGGGGGFFPEFFKAEYHPIKKALEAYAIKAAIEGAEDGDAQGIALDKGLRVRVDGIEYEVTK